MRAKRYLSLCRLHDLSSIFNVMINGQIQWVQNIYIKKKNQRSERGVKGTDSQTRDRECTAKSGDVQFCLKEHVERSTRRRMTLMTSCGIERNRLLWWSSRSRLGWINLYYPEVIVYSAFSHCCSVSLCSFLVSRTYSSRDMRAVHIMHDTDVFCMNHHESQVEKKHLSQRFKCRNFTCFFLDLVLSSCVVYVKLIAFMSVPGFRRFCVAFVCHSSLTLEDDGSSCCCVHDSY